jgi:hypothetical protein
LEIARLPVLTTEGAYIMKQGLFSRRVLSLAAVISSLGVSGALSAAPAQAALISTNACDSSALTTPFSGLGDTNDYKLVPGGSFESGTTGWTLSGGAKVVSGSEPYGATGAVGNSSLYLPAGASATTPYTCVNAAYPSLRMFARNNGALSTVLVQLVYKGLLGLVPIPVGVSALSPQWGPTLPMLTASAVPGLLSGGTTQVAIRMTALTGSSQIDDIFVDPRCRW